LKVRIEEEDEETAALEASNAIVVADTVGVDAFGEADYGDLDDTLKAAVESDHDEHEEEKGEKKERRKRVKKK
jgi:hypothetical protein